MKSLAIWYDGESESQKEKEKEKVEIDLHVNFWKLPVQKSLMGNGFNRFLDLGIKVDNSRCLNTIFIYIPFDVSDKNINDLGGTICKSDAGLLNAIFNEQYKITTSSTSDYHKVTDEDDKEIFNIYTLGKGNIRSSKKHEGTIIEIDLPASKIKKNKTYIRLRIKTVKLEGFSTIEKNPTSIINNAFTKIEIFDFRINSLRHLPNKLNEEVSNKHRFIINKIHFFYICSYKENYILSHTPFSGARKLEDNIWENYISIDDDVQFPKDETFVAYHWKQKQATTGEGVKHFNALIKTEFRHNNWSTIVIYMMFLSSFTIVMGIITNVIYTRFLPWA